MGDLLAGNSSRSGVLRWLLAALRDVGFPIVVAVFVLWRIEPELRHLVVESTRQTALLQLMIRPECRRELARGRWSVWPAGAELCAELGPGALLACVPEGSELENLLSFGEG